MNAYEAKQEARRERYQDRAAKAEQTSQSAFKQAHAISDMIPFGQPILVGHHSEGRHRRDLKRIDNAMRKSIEADDKAEYYQRKAEGVGRAGISSDDPEAVTKLKEKIARAESCQQSMKDANVVIRKAPKNEITDEKVSELVNMGYSLANATTLFKPDFCGRVGFASYALQNNSANISRMKKRIAELASAPTETTEKQVGDVTIIENTEENRLQLIFPGKPADHIRKCLKSHGFRWSRYNGAWQRHLNGNARYAAQCVLKEIA